MNPTAQDFFNAESVICYDWYDGPMRELIRLESGQEYITHASAKGEEGARIDTTICFNVTDVDMSPYNKGDMSLFDLYKLSMDTHAEAYEVENGSESAEPLTKVVDLYEALALIGFRDHSQFYFLACLYHSPDPNPEPVNTPNKP